MDRLLSFSTNLIHLESRRLTFLVNCSGKSAFVELVVQTLKVATTDDFPLVCQN